MQHFVLALHQVGDPVGLGNHVLDFVESSDILV